MHANLEPIDFHVVKLLGSIDGFSLVFLIIAMHVIIYVS